MADVKISALGAATSAGTADEYVANQGGVTRKVTLAQILAVVYPVGSIFIATVNTNPATLFGFGTWVAFGAGRALVGLNGADPDFDVAGEVGGAKTHALTTGEIPSHTHVQDSHNHTQDAHSHIENQNSATTGSLAGWGARDTSTSNSVASGYSTANATATNQAATATNQNTGGGGAHNNLQPYVVVYMWKRTA